jgi:DNA-binding NarL/FixJ family response regulator
VITVLVVDDDDLVRAGLSLLLDSSGDIRVVGQAADGEQALALARRLRPDVILMDLSMPVLDGIQAIRQLVSEQPGTRAIVFTASPKSSRLAEALAAGAVSYLVKNFRPQDLLMAIRAAAKGKS